jgi:hypothetical protein
MSISWERPAYRSGATKSGATAHAERQSWHVPPPKNMAKGPSAWIGLALMAANTTIALVDLFLLAGGMPR